LDSEKDEITKKQPFAKFQPLARKLNHIHHFPHRHLCTDYLNIIPNLVGCAWDEILIQ
jgi:hypothetical protein